MWHVFNNKLIPDYILLTMTEHVYSMQMYIQVRMQPRRLHLMKAALQVAALWLALCTCLSRVSDYKHHWTDVVAGALLGGVVAILMVGVHVRNFTNHRRIFPETFGIRTVNIPACPVEPFSNTYIFTSK